MCRLPWVTIGSDARRWRLKVFCSPHLTCAGIERSCAFRTLRRGKYFLEEAVRDTALPAERSNPPTEASSRRERLRVNVFDEDDPRPLHGRTRALGFRSACDVSVNGELLLMRDAYMAAGLSLEAPGREGPVT
jgi:hypothetical protein